MAKVCVITGGGSGMGLATARFMPKDMIVVLAGRTEKKLAAAAEELKKDGFEAAYHTCDTSKREDVKALLEYAASLGTVKTVIQAAGVSPAQQQDPEKVFRINALGTVYMNEESAAVMREGGVIVDIASNSAYMLPGFLIPKKLYPLASTDENTFLTKMLGKCRMAKEGYARAGMAYALSKNFAVWYSRQSAHELGPKGIRVVSLSPGLIATDMGNAEKENGGGIIPYTTVSRMGTPEELGFAIASLADERNGYLSGVDILCDGGGVYWQKEHKKH